MDENHRAKHQRHHDSGHHPRYKQLADGLLGEDGINDEHDAGGNQHADAAACGDATSGQLHIVFVAAHFGEGNGRHCGGSGRAGAADGAEGAACADGCHGQAAGHAAHPAVGGVKQPAADAGVEGDLPHENEQRNRGEIVI